MSQEVGYVMLKSGNVTEARDTVVQITNTQGMLQPIEINKVTLEKGQSRRQ